MTKLQDKFQQYFNQSTFSTTELNKVLATIVPTNEASPYEQLAVFAAGELQKIIQDIRRKNSKVDLKKLDKIRQFNAALLAEITTKPNHYTKDGEVINPYMQAFLIQVSQFNSHLNIVESLVDFRKDNKTIAIDTTVNRDLAAIAPIHNPLLPHQGSLKININVHKERGRFRAPFVYGKEDTGHSFEQFFYDPKKTNKGKKHQDEPA